MLNGCFNELVQLKRLEPPTPLSRMTYPPSELQWLFGATMTLLVLLLRLEPLGFESHSLSDPPNANGLLDRLSQFDLLTAISTLETAIRLRLKTWRRSQPTGHTGTPSDIRITCSIGLLIAAACFVDIRITRQPSPKMSPKRQNSLKKHHAIFGKYLF